MKFRYVLRISRVSMYKDGVRQLLPQVQRRGRVVGRVYRVSVPLEHRSMSLHPWSGRSAHGGCHLEGFLRLPDAFVTGLPAVRTTWNSQTTIFNSGHVVVF